MVKYYIRKKFIPLNMGLLVLVDNKDDLVYKHVFNNTLNIYDLLVVCYGSIDILNTIIKMNKSNYFECIDTHEDFEVTAYIFNSFYKCFFIHKKLKNVKKFMYEICQIFIEKIVYEDVWSYEDQINDINDIYRIYFKI